MARLCPFLDSRQVPVEPMVTILPARHLLLPRSPTEEASNVWYVFRMAVSWVLSHLFRLHSKPSMVLWSGHAPCTRLVEQEGGEMSHLALLLSLNLFLSF